VNHGGQREIALVRQFHAEKRGANDRYLVNPIIRWRGREWRLRVDLTRLTREHLNGRNRRFSVTQPLRLERPFLPLSRHSGAPRTGRVGWQAALLADCRARRG
jgi:hypothetical protein